MEAEDKLEPQLFQEVELPRQRIADNGKSIRETKLPALENQGLRIQGADFHAVGVQLK